MIKQLIDKMNDIRHFSKHTSMKKLTKTNEYSTLMEFSNKYLFVKTLQKNKGLNGLFISILLLVVMFCGLSESASAATRTVTNNTSWSTLTVAAGDNVIVKGGATLTINTGTAVCANIQLGGGNPNAGSGRIIFNSGSQLTVSGSITLGSGTRTGTINMTNGGTLKIGVSLVLTSGVSTFTEGTGTVEYTSTTGSQTVTSTTYNNLVLDNSSGTNSTDGNVTISGDLTTTAGGVLSTAYNLTLNGASTCGGAINASAGTVTYTNYSTNILPGTYYNLTKTGTTNSSLCGDATINGVLTLSGNILLGSNNLTLGTGCTVSGTFSNASMIILGGTGMLKKQSNSVSGFEMVYPVGTGTVYSPMQISSLSATGITAPATLNIQLFNAAASGISGTYPLNRYWVTSVSNLTGSILANVNFTYASSDISGSSTSYELFYKPTSTGIWGIPAGVSASGINPMYASAATTLNATWSGAISNKKVFYSLKSGSWDDPNVWTLDQSGTQVNNPSGLTPSTSPTSLNDEVVILSGRTITVPTDTKSNAKLTVDGILDFSTTTGHSFSTINGTGRIRLAGDNFPSGDATDFITEGQGQGTVEYYGASFLLNSSRTFYNMEVNMTSGNVLTLMKDYKLNGALWINNGTLQINDNTSTTAIKITSYGNVTVGSTGKITTGTGNARHQFNFYGDLTNNGQVLFTNRTVADYINEATNGIVDANFLHASKDQNVFCNGLTNFYRIEIDKGSDATYALNLAATSSANFNLFGYANESHGSVAQLTANNNALGLIKGTVKIGEGISIPVLSVNSGNYNISENARLWVAGGSVAKNTGTAIVIYGKIQITEGTLDAKINSGLTLRDNGIIYVDGGTVNVNQIRTSQLGASNIGGYVQTGGTVNVLGGSTDSDFYSFCLTYPSCVFNMSGGVLHVYPTTTGKGGIFINSDPENIQVTGGNVIFETNGSLNFIITSRAPFWNLDLKNSTTSSRDFILSNGSAVGPNDVDLAAQPLKVLNNLRIWGKQSGGTSYPAIRFTPVTSATNVNDVYVGGSFYIEQGAQYVPVYGGTSPYNTTATQPTAVNTTYFNQTDGTSGVDTLYWGDTSNELELGNFVQNRTHGNELRMVAPSGRTSESVIMDINGGASVLSGSFSQNLYSVRTWGSIVNNDRMGVWYAGTTPSGAQIRFSDNTSLSISTSSGAVFGNIQFNVTPPTIISLTSNVYIERMEYLQGLIYLKGYNLKVDNLWNMNTGLFENSTVNSYMKVANSSYSGNSMIFTDGKASDGGLTLKVSANSATTESQSTVINNQGPITFPVGFTANGGTTLYFRPAQMVVKSFSDDGYVTVRPVMGELKTSNLTGGEILQHYWRITNSDFSTKPTVAYRFYYRNQTTVSNVDMISGAANEANYLPGKVLDQTPYTRSNELLADNDIIKNIGSTPYTRAIVFNGTSTTGAFSPAVTGFTLENANYTAGVANRFTGSVLIYYSRDLDQQTDWTSANAWTRSDILNAAYSPHDSRQPGAGANYPKAGDVAVIGWIPWTDAGRTSAQLGQPHCMWIDNTTMEVAELIFTKMTDASGNPVPRNYRSNFQFRPTLCINWYSGQLKAKLVKGEGLFWNRNSDPDYTQMDVGEFAREDSSYVIYENFDDNRVVYNTPALFPNLYLSNDGWGGNDKDFSFAKDIETTGNVEILGDMNLVLPTGSTGNITVGRNLIMFENTSGGSSSGGGAELDFGNTGTARTVVVKGDLKMNNTGGIIRVSSPGTTPINHNLNVYGNIIQNTTSTGSGLQLWTSATQDRITLSLLGSNNMTYNLTSGSIPNFYRIIVDKGTDNTTTATFNCDFNLNGPTSGAGVAKALELKSGTFIVNNSAVTLNLTTGNDLFKIPAAAGLEMRRGIVYANGTSGINLDGLLKISGGSLDMSGGNNYIEYSSSGAANIVVSSGTLRVGGQIRRSPTAKVGILKYSQTGGVVEVGYNAAPTGSRGVFEILNEGSSFEMTGGDLYIMLQQTSPTVSALYLDPETINVSSSATIHLGGSVTPAGQTIGLYSTQPLPNLRVDNSSGNSPIAQMQVIPATITSLLTIDAGATFDANGLDLNLKGNFTNNGTFIPNGNTTYLSGSSDQTITGNTNFYNLIKNQSNNVKLTDGTTQLNIANNLKLEDGTFTDNSNTVYVKGDCQNDATHVYGGSGDGIALTGSASQILTGNGTFGKLTINNASGVNLPVGNQLTITNSLKMQAGVLDIDKNLLSLAVGAVIEQASPFSANNMIQTNISFTDNGVRKIFPSGATASFIYPMGFSGKYTPVTLAITAKGNSTGGITVKPANEIHPSIIEDTETGTQVVDASNALKYYWTLKSSGISGFTGSAKMKCIASDIAVTSPYTSADYITARLLADGSGNWNKFSKADFDETNNILNYSFSSTDDNGISGDYTAGAVDATLNGAIPDNVSIYQTNTTGNWATSTIWTPNVTGGPRGAIAIINDGHTASVTANNQIGYMTKIYGTLNLGTTNEHRLGIVTGTGLLYMEQGDVPAGVYDDFFSSAGGTLEFGGVGGYDVLGNIMEVNNLTFSGSLNKNLPNNDFEINGDLLINGASTLTIVNTHNRTIYLDGNITRTSGTFTAGTGSDAAVIFSGTLSQQLTGTFTGSNAFNILGINNSNGLVLNSDVEISSLLRLTKGLITPGSNILRIKYDGEAYPVAGSSSSFVNGPLIKELMLGGSFTFPIGDNNTNLGAIGVSSISGTSGIQDWKATYHYSNPTLAGYDADSYTSPISQVSKTEYWDIQAPSGGKSAITINMDGSSDVASAISNLNNLRVVGWNPYTLKWNVVGSGATVVGSATNGSVTTTGLVDYSTYKYFTLASIMPVVAGTATITSGDINLCNGATADIVVAFTGTAPWVLTYKVASTTVTSPAITSSPYTITVSPTITTTYQLIGVTANGVAGSVVGNTDAVVTVNPVPTVILNSNDADNTFCQGTSVTYTATAGLASYNFRVDGVSKQSGSGNTYTTSTLAGGSRSVDVIATNSAGCSATSSAINNTVNTIPTAAGSITGSPSQCRTSSGAYSITAISNATNYTWAYSGSGATITPSSNSATVAFNSSATSGNLTVYASNSCGNGSVSSLTITVSTSSTITASGTISGSSAVCQGSSVTYNVSAIANATGYKWYYSGTGATVNGSGASVDASGVTLGTTSITIDFANTASSGNLTVRGTNGCNDGPVSLTFPVTVNSMPTAVISPASPVTCQGVSVTLTAAPSGGSGTYSTHSWTDAGASSLNYTNIQAPVFTNSTAGTYNLLYTVTDNKGCKGQTSATVTVVASPTVTAGADILLCSAPTSITMAGAVVGGSYSGTPTWSGTGGTWNQNYDPSLATFTPSASSGSTVATLTLTGANGCSNVSSTRVIKWSSQPSASISGTTSICGGGSANISIAITGGASPYVVKLSDGSTHTGYISGSSISVSPSVTTTYSIVSVDDNIGCTASTLTGSAVITVGSAPSISGTTPAARCDVGTVTLGATASAGTINWYSSLTGGSSLGTGTSFTTPSISTNTTYYVDATNNGCTTSSRTAVLATVNALPTLSINISETSGTANDGIVCSGSSITLTASGASSYSWTGGVTNGVAFIPAATNSYTVTGTDANSCSNTKTVTITVNPTPNTGPLYRKPNN
jgi:hypothetical protein